MATISFKGRHVQQYMILKCVRWYLAYSLGYRDSEALMAERGVSVDHRTINRWVIHYAPQLDAAFRGKKKHVGGRWRMDEPSIKVNGQWTYDYRAVDTHGQTIDVLVTATRDHQTAVRVLKKAMKRNGQPSLAYMGHSGATTAGLKQVRREHHPRMTIRQCKYLNNIIEHDHRRIKRLTRPRLGFKNFYAAQRTVASIDVRALIKKGQLRTRVRHEPSFAHMFYALAA